MVNLDQIASNGEVYEDSTMFKISFSQHYLNTSTSSQMDFFKK